MKKSGLCGLALLCALILPACATPTSLRNAKASDMARLQAGMSAKEARHAARTAGEPIAVFPDKGRDCEIRRFTVKETGASYYLLWVDGGLQGVLGAERAPHLEFLPPYQSDPSALPHSEGFQDLLDSFASAAVPSEVDFTRMQEGFGPRDKKRERAEMIMWSPVILVFLPLMPLQLLVVGKAAAGYSPFYSLERGWTPEQVGKKIGEPVATMGDPSSYGIWTYRYKPVEFDELPVSIGFRDGRVEWIRYGYGAGDTD